MNRRQFLKLLTALGGSSLSFPAISSIKSLSTSRPAYLPTRQIAKRGAVRNAIPRIGIVAIGGAGCSNLCSLQNQLPHLSRTVAVDTSPFTLYRTQADRYIWLGGTTDKTADPNTVRLQAKASKTELREAIQGLDMAFLILGLGGAAGAGIAPIVLDVAREEDILTIATPITPFSFEGVRRNQIARTGVGAITRRADVTIELPNELFALGAEEEPIPAVLERATSTFREIYTSVSTLVSKPGIVGIDFEDCRTLLHNTRQHWAFGYGSSSKRDLPLNAVDKALNSPLMGLDRMNSAKKAIVSIRSQPDRLTTDSFIQISNYLSGIAPDVQKLYGAVLDDSLRDDVVVSVLVA